MKAAQAVGDDADALTARNHMFRIGQRSLRMMPRNPELLRCFALEYQDVDLQKAETYAAQLIAYEPHSAEAHLFLGDVYARTGRLAEAEAIATRAVALDPLFPQAHSRLARYQFMSIERILLGKAPGRDVTALVRGTDSEAHRVLTSACDHYEEAEALGEPLKSLDALRYTTALVLTNDLDRATTVSHQLAGTPQWPILHQRLQYFSYVRGTPITLAPPKPEPCEPSRANPLLPWERPAPPGSDAR